MSKLPVLLTVLLLAGTAFTQNDSRFLTALQSVQAQRFVQDAGNIVSFADVDAAFAARGVQAPESWSDDFDPSLLMSLPPTMPSDLVQYLNIGAPDYPARLGFDFFDISHTIEFGQPPEQAFVLFGDFAAESVAAAFMARGYVGDGALLCPTAGCDTGHTVDLANRDPGNPFGGALGRSFPIWPTAQSIATSPSLAALNAIVTAAETTTLADLPEVQALDAVLADWPQLVGVSIVNSLALAVADPLQPAEDREVLAAQPLPPYSLVAYASTADAVNEYGLVLLVYGDATAAGQAASALDARLAQVSSIRRRVPFAEYLADHGTLAPAEVRTDAASGYSVVVVSLAAPLPQEPAALAGAPFSRLREGLLARDTAWLLPGASQPGRPATRPR